MKAQENLKKNIENFDADNLKPIESIEKISLPTRDDIEQEKEIIETETQANKEVFQKTVLKTLESFDASELKHVEVPETSIDVSGFVQEKARQKLLSEISMTGKYNFSFQRSALLLINPVELYVQGAEIELPLPLLKIFTPQN